MHGEIKHSYIIVVGDTPMSRNHFDDYDCQTINV